MEDCVTLAGGETTVHMEAADDCVPDRQNEHKDRIVNILM